MHLSWFGKPPRRPLGPGRTEGLVHSWTGGVWDCPTGGACDRAAGGRSGEGERGEGLQPHHGMHHIHDPSSYTRDSEHLSNIDIDIDLDIDLDDRTMIATKYDSINARY